MTAGSLLVLGSLRLHGSLRLCSSLMHPGSLHCSGRSLWVFVSINSGGSILSRVSISFSMARSVWLVLSYVVARSSLLFLSCVRARSSKLVRSCHVAMLVRGQWFSLLPWPCSLIQFGSLRFIGHARSVLLVLSQLLARSGPMILLLVHDSFLSRVSISVFMARSGHVVLSVNLARSEPLVLSQAMTRTSVRFCGHDPHAP